MTTAKDKRLEKGARSREEILDAAERVMSYQGYNGTSVALISSESGLPNSSIYWHFASKSAILAAVMERGAERFFAATPVVQVDSEDPWERIHTNLQAAAEAIEGNRDFLRILMLLVISNHDPEVQSVVQRVRQDGRERLRLLLEYSFAARWPERASFIAESLADYALSSFDGIFFAVQAKPELRYAGGMRKLATALVALAETS